MYIMYAWAAITGTKVNVKAHSVTLELDHPYVVAQCSLQSTTNIIGVAEFVAYQTTAVGILQCVSNGVEENFPSLSHNARILFRDNVTSITMGVMGGPGTHGMATYFCTPTQHSGQIERRDERLEHHAYYFVGEPKTGEVLHMHEIIGSKKFIASHKESGAKNALDFAGRSGAEGKMAVVRAGPKFKYAADQALKINAASNKVIVSKAVDLRGVKKKPSK